MNDCSSARLARLSRYLNRSELPRLRSARFRSRALRPLILVDIPRSAARSSARVGRFRLHDHRLRHFECEEISHPHREQRHEDVECRVGAGQRFAVEAIDKQIAHRDQPRPPPPRLGEPEKRRDEQRLKSEPDSTGPVFINGRGNRHRARSHPSSCRNSKRIAAARPSLRPPR